MDWFKLACAVTAAIAGPLFMVMIRHDVRLSRLRALFDFDQLFNMSTPDDAEGRPAGGYEPAPTYEFVRARYTSDIRFPSAIPQMAINKLDLTNPELKAFLYRLHWWSVRSSWQLLLASLPLIVLSAFGLLDLLFSPTEASLVAQVAHFPASLLIIGQAASPAAAETLARNVTVVGEAAFIGALLFVFLLFLRALATFDLSPLTVLRGTIYFLLGIAGAVVLYLAVPDMPAQVIGSVKAVADEASTALGRSPPQPQQPPPAPPGGKPPGTKPPGPKPPAPAGGPPTPQCPPNCPSPPAGNKPLPSIWIALAFVLGFVPDLAFNQILAQVQRLVKIKSTDDRLTKATPSTPLEIIDGIDILTRFRLQESNVFEVQNLAVSNPVMLFVETPFGIYQLVDWVAQAQLCVAVGPERFLELQKRSIRTIFDLERAVLSVYSTSQLRRYVAGVLLAGLPASSTPSEIAVGPFAKIPRTPPAARVNAEDFGLYAAELFGEPAIASDGTTLSPDPDMTIRHLVLTMVDDLHVCRLRQVWQQIMSKIDGKRSSHTESNRLWDTGWEPTLPPNWRHPRP